SAGRSVSPAARAARALALAGRGEESVSARERAATVWDVLPVVYADAMSGDEPTGASDGTGVPSIRSERGPAGSFGGRTFAGRDLVMPDGSMDGGFAVERPGLGALSARAGEALGSYVTPHAPTFATSPSSSPGTSAAPHREVGAVMRAPTAAQELVRTGRPSGRHGGGEVEIPSWFESAARKMLEERSGASDGISLAELTLVTSAPSSHIAASSRTAPSAGPIAPGMNTGAAQSGAAPQVDIEKVANEIYRHILVLMDVARARNGEPYL
ncbi:MAG: hypothetical protein M3680_31850, partial [Myxococcota bacterium]|nr:hypothetical protein [Myxococcota bacterium]